MIDSKEMRIASYPESTCSPYTSSSLSQALDKGKMDTLNFWLGIIRGYTSLKRMLVTAVIY